jgi:hypothetical protein
MVVPAKAGTQTTVASRSTWVPAFARMTQFTQERCRDRLTIKKRSKALDLAPDFDPLNFLEHQRKRDVHQRLATQ